MKANLMWKNYIYMQEINAIVLLVIEKHVEKKKTTCEGVNEEWWSQSNTSNSKCINCKRMSKLMIYNEY